MSDYIYHFDGVPCNVSEASAARCRRFVDVDPIADFSTVTAGVYVCLVCKGLMTLFMSHDGDADLAECVGCGAAWPVDEDCPF